MSDPFGCQIVCAHCHSGIPNRTVEVQIPEYGTALSARPDGVYGPEKIPGVKNPYHYECARELGIGVETGGALPFGCLQTNMLTCEL